MKKLTEQRLGRSNKFFYYYMSQNASFDLRIKVTIRNLDISRMKEAIGEALRRYPELSARTVIRGSVLTSVRNDEELLFIPRDGKSRCFATEETNGYLLYFDYEGDSIEMYWYHGLSDVAGAYEYFKLVLYLYGVKTGFDFSEEEIDQIERQVRLTETVIDATNEADLLDPYGAYGDSTRTPEHTMDTKWAYAIPASDYPEEADYYHCVSLSVSCPAFIAETKKYGTSFIPLLSDIISGAFRRAYTPGDKPVTAMVPVNLRKYFGSTTKVNCSDGVLIPYFQEDEALDIEDRCRKWKKYMMDQSEPDNLALIMGRKAGIVDAIEAQGAPITDEVNKRTKLPNEATDFRAISYALTYPGNLTLPEGLDRLTEDFCFEAYGRGCSVIVYTYKDMMNLQALCRSDEMKYGQTVADAFRELGFEVSVRDMKRVRPNRMRIEKLDVIG